MHLRRWLAPALTLALVAVFALPARATPPSPPLDFTLRPLEDTRVGRPTRFEVVATPRLSGGRLTIELTPPPDVVLDGGARRRVVDRAPAFVATRFEYAAHVPPGLTRRVYVRATLEMPDGTRYTRGENLALLAGAERTPAPRAQLTSDGTSGRLLAFDGEGGAPVLAPASAQGSWIATGQFLYKDREQDATGFTGVEPDRPARRVDVQVFDATTLTVLATGATDASGNYSIPVTDALTRNVRVRMVALSSATPGLLVDVRNNASARIAYAVNGPQVNGHVPTADVNFGAVTAAAGAGGEAFNVFDVLLNGCDFFFLLEGARPNLRVTAYWEPLSVDGTYFLSSDNSVRLRGTEGYDDTVIGHEQGHFVANHWSKDQSPGGTHYIGDNHQDLRLSWSEGFATWYAASARRALGVGPRPDLYIDTDGSPGVGNLSFSYSFETPNVAANGGACEVAVTACL